MVETKHPLKVFLCHSSHDKPQIRELAQRLSDEGWIDPWLDEKKLLPGHNWRLKIEEAVETSDIVIVCLSSNSVSKEGFVQKELKYARDVSLEKPEESIFLIPLRIDECDVPRGFRLYQWADYFGEKKDEAYNALLESLSLRYEQKLKLNNEERARKEKEELKQKAKEMAEREAAEKVKREKAEREAAERIERERKKRELAEKAERENAERQAARKIELEKFISKSLAALKSALKRTRPFFRIAGVAGIVILLFWGGSLVIYQFTSLIPTANPSTTIVSTITPVPATKTPNLIATKAKVPAITVLMFEDFEDKKEQFSYFDSYASEWKYITDHTGNTIYEIDNTKGDKYPGIRFGSTSWSTYALEYKIRFPEILDNTQVLVAFSGPEGNTYTQAIFPRWGEQILAYDTSGDGWNRLVTKSFVINAGTWYSVRDEVKDSIINIYVDNLLIISHVATKPLTNGNILIKVNPGALVQFDDIRVTTIE